MDLIIGGGVTGLSYAAFTDNEYLVIEAEKEVGGYCRTIKQDGFIWDYSGHFFHFRDEKLKQFVFDNMAKDEILEIIKLTRIYHKGKLIDYPFQKNIHQLDKEELIESLYDLFSNEYTTYTTFKEMLYAKFGRTIAELFLIPYNEKLYACNLDKLDVDAMGRFFPYADKEDIIKNFNASENSSYNGTFVYPAGGAVEYIRSICSHVDMNKVALNEKLVAIDVDSKTVRTDKRVVKYDNLISTIPFPELLSLARIDFNKSLYTSNQVLVFNLGFDSPGHCNDHWIYFADPQLSFYRVGFYNNIFGHGPLSLYVELGFTDNATIDINEQLTCVLRDLNKVGITTDHKLVSYSTVIMNPAYVHVTADMEKDRAAKMTLLAGKNIYSIGRYGAWYYCSIEDNIKEAQNLAEKLCIR